ncbi:hypothetical protein ACIOEZ_34600 [Streptomyces sp. NPDC087866]|uniref:hypothetical protein n=1 Tax=Streptomyces sp. NPDC087866 TaxID=3365815 RepID=UPI00381C52CD
MSENPRPSNVTDGPIHEWFSLSYSNYLVLHRTLLQSMPTEWQERMVACLDELQHAYSHLEQVEAYEVTPSTEHIVGEMTDLQLRMASIDVDLYGGAVPPAGLTGDELAEWQEKHETAEPAYSRNGVELDPVERVLIPTIDPVPHYNRGRTYIEPKISAASPVEPAPGSSPLDHLKAMAGNARNAISHTHAGRTADATEHVHAIERLLTAYHQAARTPKES